jgi:translation initiation factor 1
VADDNSRLVYSTGGPLPKETRNDKPPRAQPATAGHGVRLRLDRRASGRWVTLVGGLRLPQAKLLELLGELKAACGAGGTLKEGVLELQGDQRDKVEAALEARGIRSKRAGG